MRPYPSLQVLDGQTNGRLSSSFISFATFIDECQDSLGDLLSIVEMQSDVDKKWTKKAFGVYFEAFASVSPQGQNFWLKKAQFYRGMKVKLLAWIRDELKKPYFLRGNDQIIRAMALEHLQSLESIPTLHLVASVDDARVEVIEVLDSRI